MGCGHWDVEKEDRRTKRSVNQDRKSTHHRYGTRSTSIIQHLQINLPNLLRNTKKLAMLLKLSMDVRNQLLLPWFRVVVVRSSTTISQTRSVLSKKTLQHPECRRRIRKLTRNTCDWPRRYQTYWLQKFPSMSKVEKGSGDVVDY
jgi:hypothetical protein